MQIKEPIVISRRLKRFEGSRCTVFGVEKYFGIIPGQIYLIVAHLYDCEEYEKTKPFLKKATIPAYGRGPQFIVPRSRIVADDGVYKITIMDPRDSRYEELCKEALISDDSDDNDDDDDDDDAEDDYYGEGSDDGSGE
mgnify:CR=1 FL=1